MYGSRSDDDDAFDGCQVSYRVRVRGTMYLWGSEGVNQDISFGSPLILHISNDRFGVAIEFGTKVSGGARSSLGTLQPGERISIPVQGISGVFATCPQDSSVTCVVTSPR